MTIETVGEAKAKLRQAALSRRGAVSDAVRNIFSTRLIDEGVRLARSTRALAVSAYHPIRGEADTLPLLAALAAEGVATALPVTGPRSLPLTFRLWRPGDPTVRGPMNIPEPPPEAAIVDPDLVFVPLAVFDRRGHRIGYGAGHYDRTLADLRGRKAIRAVGIGYAACETERVPNEPHDQRLDFILTENEWIEIAGSD